MSYHFFPDGNGRTGRLWQSLILQKWQPFFAWLPVETLIHEHQDEYYQTLNAANTDGESTIFVEFMLDIIKEALLEISDVGINVGINVSDEEILQMLAAEPKLTAAGLSQELGISKRQMERRLAELKNEGRLEHVGARKNGYWKVKG